MKPWLAALGLILLILFPSTQAAEAEEELLDPEEAYVLSLTAPDPNTLVARWDIADGYYPYKNKFQIELADAEGVSITEVEIPQEGKIKEDEFFGRQEVFYQQAEVIARLRRDDPEVRDITVKVGYQGCADLGICYPPMTKTIPVSLPPVEGVQPAPPAEAPPTEAAPPSPLAEKA